MKTFFQAIDDVSEIHIVQDKKINFFSVICLHRNGRGPAIGGCRFMEYSSHENAIQDAIRLSKAMSFKAAISELPHDGGKAVIVKPKQFNREDFLYRFAECVESLGGKYITTIDSGTSQSDMSIVKNKTQFVTGYQDESFEENNISASTALGVYRGIKAAIKLKYGVDSVSGLHIAVQGVGNVGYRLIKLLLNEGAKITISDIRENTVQDCIRELGVKAVNPNDIFSLDCDIFSPCALGQVINPQTIQIIKAKIIAGAANDQLATSELSDILDQKGILYIPDYVINAGGLIHLALQMQGQDKFAIDSAVCKIEQRIVSLKEKADMNNMTLFSMAKISALETMNS